MTPAVTRAALRRTPGNFQMQCARGKVNWSYSASFEWEGHTFVVHRSYFSDYIWKTSHKDSGFALSTRCNASTCKRSAELAVEELERQGKRRLLNAIRKNTKVLT